MCCRPWNCGSAPGAGDAAGTAWIDRTRVTDLGPQRFLPMKQEFATQVTGWAFVAAGVMFWAGWALLPHHLGTYLVPDDFSEVRAHLRLWIWMYRVHIFGMVITAMALMALAALLADSPARIIVWPGAGVATAGTFVSALAAAFYYHHGVWGAVELDGKSAEEIHRFVANLLVDTEYVTCLVRFGRVFSGLGWLVLGWGLVKWKLLPQWIGILAALIGLAAMALTMGLPDDLSFYLPVFHIQAAWLVSVGVAILRSGVRSARWPPDSPGDVAGRATAPR
jgi:hypothetical protein